VWIPIIVWAAFGGSKIYARLNEKRIISANRQIREQKLAELLGS